jgi:hypothetical protein
LQVYIDNDANAITDCIPAHRDSTGGCKQIDYNAIGIARNTRVSIALPNPATVGNNFSATASISANNVSSTIYDTIEISANQEVTVSYVPGSAVEYNNGSLKNGIPLSDAIVTPQGAPVGYSAVNGNFPGGFNYAATVEIKVAVHRH